MVSLILHAPADSIASRSLTRAVEARNGLLKGQSEPYGVEFISPDSQRCAGARRALLASLDDYPLFTRSGGGPIVPTESLNKALAAAANRDMPVIAVMNASKSISGPEVAGLAVAGFSALVDDRHLGDERVLESCVEACMNNSTSTMHVYGEPADAITSHVEMLQEWELELLESGLDLVTCWKVCLATGQLEKLEPAPPGASYGFTDLARGLNIAEPLTGFRMNEMDVRKILSPISMFCGLDDLGKGARRDIPARLRQLGFPKFPPSMEGKSFMETSKLIYEAIRDGALTQLCAIGTCSHVSLPGSEKPGKRRTANGKNKH